MNKLQGEREREKEREREREQCGLAMSQVEGEGSRGNDVNGNKESATDPRWCYSGTMSILLHSYYSN